MSGLTAVLAVAGCNGASGDDARTAGVACDPLAPKQAPIVLGPIVAVGKDAGGHYYVADTDPSEPSRARVFISDGDTLSRRRVLGTGARGDSDWFWSIENGDSSERLIAHKDGDRLTGIALAPAGERTFYDQLGPSAMQLMPADPSEVAGLDVENLPGEIRLMYVANVEDGSRIVVTTPVDDFSYERYRVFDGKDGELIERSCAYVGPLSYVAFDCEIDTTVWHITFPSQLAPSIDAELRQSDSTALSFTLVEPPALSPNEHFVCFKP